MDRVDGMRRLAEQLSIGLRGFMLVARRSGDAFPVTRQQLDVLGSLVQGPQRVSDLADELGVRMPTVTTQLTRLERDGLVTRDRVADDARVVMISLTGQGERVLRQGLDRWYSELSSRIERLTAAERATLEAAAPVLRKVFPLPAAAGRDTAGRDTAGKDTAGRDTVGSEAAGNEAAGKHAAGARGRVTAR